MFDHVCNFKTLLANVHNCSMEASHFILLAKFEITCILPLTYPLELSILSIDIVEIELLLALNLQINISSNLWINSHIYFSMA